MNLMLDIGCCQGGIEASSIEHILSFKMRGLACCCGEFSKFYKYFHFQQIWLREKMIEKKKNMNQNAYYSRLFIEKKIATWREHKILQSSHVFLQYIRKI